MLARTYKTAAELGVLEHEYNALVSVLHGMEDGSINRRNFTWQQWHCGTSHCFAGWAHTLDVTAFPEIAPRSGFSLIRQLGGRELMERIPDGLSSLFSAQEGTFEMARDSLRRYLETGSHRAR